MRTLPAFGRRRLLQGSLPGALLGSGLLSACSTTGAEAPIKLAPIRARTDRIFDIAVCTRPFRAAGPRLDSERIGDTLVVHNYGHGGSGWSLSWGSSARALQLAQQASPREVAVIGCGALGLTSAILAQRAGLRVTIYAKDQLPLASSAGATGEWTPDSRIADAHVAATSFAAEWEAMARASFKTHRQFLGLPGTPVEWVDQFSVVAAPSTAGAPDVPTSPDACAVSFAHYAGRISDITPVWRRVPIASTPFKGSAVNRSEIMVFNIAGYGHTLMNDFLVAGGHYRHVEFRTPAQIAALGHRVAINCTGLGARTLWRDETVTPVRGQIQRLIPQPDVRYGLNYRSVLSVPRRDGLVVQSFAGGAMQGYGDSNEAPDRAEAEAAVRMLAEAFKPA